MKKRMLSIVMAVFMVLTMCSVPISDSVYGESVGQAYSGEGIVGGNIYYELDVNTNTVMITGCDESVESVVIPDTIEGVAVESIGSDAFRECSSLTEITIPTSVTSIDSWAFYDCSGLTSIEIPSGVTKIDECTFYGCSSLSRIVIPSSVTSIGSSAFRDCSSLSSIEIPNGITDIESCTFSGCSSLSSITIPTSVTRIWDEAFWGCNSLTEITIPDSVTTIDPSAFSDCSMLMAINVSDTNANYVSEDGALFDREKTELIAFPGGKTGNYSVPDGVQSTAYCAFAGCGGLTEVIIPESMTSIGHYTFQNCSNLIKIIIPNSVTEIDEFAFSGCDNVTIYGYTGSYAETYAKNQNIPFEALGEGSSSNKPPKNPIGDSADDSTNNPTEQPTDKPTESEPEKGDIFSDEKNMADYEVIESEKDTVEVEYKAPIDKNDTSVIIPATVKLSDGTTAKVTAIDDKAFKNNNKIKKVTIGKNVETIGKETFAGAKKLESVTIGIGVNKIGKKAFYGSKNLKNITIKTKKLTSSKVGKQAFKGTFAKVKVNVPESKMKAYSKFLYKKGLNKKAKLF